MEGQFLVRQTYDDEITYNLIGAAVEILREYRLPTYKTCIHTDIFTYKLQWCTYTLICIIKRFRLRALTIRAVDNDQIFIFLLFCRFSISLL